jgi:hypothetical protein
VLTKMRRVSGAIGGDWGFQGEYPEVGRILASSKKWGERGYERGAQN